MSKRRNRGVQGSDELGVGLENTDSVIERGDTANISS